MKIRKAEFRDLDKIVKMGCNVKEFETSKEVVVFWPRHILENLISSSKNVSLLQKIMIK